MGQDTETAPRQVDDTIPVAGSKKTLFDFQDFDHSSLPLEKEDWPVIIIGSSMVGMTLGVLLGYHGIKSVSFDRHPSTAIHPRAALYLLRSVEIFRQLGLEDKLRRNSALDFDLDAGMLIVEKLVGGKTLAKLQESDPAKVAEVTPCRRLWLTQNMFEPLLRESARDFGAVQEFSQAVVHYEEQDDGVIVVVQDQLQMDKYRKFKTRYLVACDGNRSATRRKEDIAWAGPGVVGENISINFRADLRPFLGTRAKHGVTYVSNSQIDAGFRLESGGQAGFMIVSRAGDKKRFPPDSVTARDAKRYFADASGIQEGVVDLTVESIAYWSVAGLNSERFASKKGRVFLAGDAAHVMPPTGGMGGNTGLQDVYNLAWKLAYVLTGKASPSLLGTYNSERQPAAERTMRQAFSRLQTRVFRQPPDEPELSDIICELGLRYPSGAVLQSGKRGDDDEYWEDPFSPSALPGSRLPHVRLIDSSDPTRELSTLDLVKRKFVLFTTDSQSPWREAAKNVVDFYTLNKSSSPFRDPEDKFASVSKLDGGEGLLIRPDGVIAWRAGKQESGHESALKEALSKILGG